MTESYKIITDMLKVDDIIAQLRAIKTYPAMIHVYDRVFKLETKDECYCLCTGLEIGNYITEDQNFAAQKK